MAYHHLQVCRNRWFPRRLRAHQRRGSLHRHGHLHHRHIWRQLLDSRLVRIYLRSDAREEGCRYRYRDDCYERFVHLDSVLVAQVGRAKICYCAFSIATFALAWVAKIVFMRKNKKLRESDNEVQTFYVY
jgi:hypothetical protein